MRSNHFCIFLLLATLICFIVGIFLVVTSLHYGQDSDHNVRFEVRRSAEASIHADEPRPVFPDDYHASGLLILPHSSIAEPFEIWFSATLGASRIDYYYGTDKSFQRGDEDSYGKYYKIVPMYNDKQGNFVGCWTIQGTSRRPVIAQTIVPNMTWFKYVTTEVYTGTLTTKWHYEYWAYGMLNSQYVWVTKAKPYRPIRYEMKGYDAMLGSYYDHYVLEYVSFEQWRPQMKRFELRKEIQCFNWSLTLESSLIANPMQEFTPFSAEHLVDVEDMYTDYKNDHGKVYDQEEHAKRKHTYKHNMRYIRSMNRKKNHFKLSSNHFTDLSHDEMEAQLGAMTKADPRNHTGMKPLHKHKPVYVGQAPNPIDVPDELDWRDYGAVSPVKGQGICGSCYSFSAAGAAEGANFLKTGRLVELSSQQILDCSWGSGNHGCKGGHYAAALSFLYLHGAATLNSYGKYLAQEGVCHFNDTVLGAKPDAFAYVPRYNNTALKRSVAKFGPAAVSINVSPLSFKFYSHGIYHDPECWPNRTRHSALVVGYGKANGKEYWLVKNSWSDSWGEKGYIRVAMDDNMCGITEAPVVALVNHVTFQFPVKEKILSINSEDPSSFGQKVKALKRKKKKSKAKSTKKSVSTSEGINEPKKSSESTETPNVMNLKNAEKQNLYEDGVGEQFKIGESKTPDANEIPKIEPNNEKHDIGALGDSVATPEATATTNEDTRVSEHEKSSEKPSMFNVIQPHTKSDDFKLPVQQSNVDDTKLPNAFSDTTQGNSHVQANALSYASEYDNAKDKKNAKETNMIDSDIKQKITKDDRTNIRITFMKEGLSKQKAKRKTRANHRDRKKFKKSKFSRKKADVMNKKLGFVKSLMDKRDNVPVHSDRLQKVLTDTMKDIYAKIDNAVILAQNK